jgi:hypothetical protein
MNPLDFPCLSLAIAPLAASGESHWAIWVINAPYPGGMVHHDRHWPDTLKQTWQSWQALFSLQAAPNFAAAAVPFETQEDFQEGSSYSSRLMQSLGTGLWQWLCEDPIRSAFNQSQGIAIGQNRPLRLRLDVRHPAFIPLPWEIMQPQIGKSGIGLNFQVLFSRTTSDVDNLMPLKLGQKLQILLVLGTDEENTLQLQAEADLFVKSIDSLSTIDQGSHIGNPPVPCEVKVLLQPSRAQLLEALNTGQHNLFFYGGHGITAPDGGRLCLQLGEFLSGTELAQALIRNQITLAVFNACWGAQLDYIQEPETGHLKAIPRSSLAETLIHHGVPAVLGMRDVIADGEALHFIQRFVQALRDRCLVDEAMVLARQHLLSLYGFNQPTWTLPVLYMHPEFNGQLISPTDGRTELPTSLPFVSQFDPFPKAEIRSKTTVGQAWAIEGGMLRVGRHGENDLVLQEQWVSQKHAEIICRTVGDREIPTYFLKDFSRFGTLVFQENQWKRIHRQEMILRSGSLLRFGSVEGEVLEFLILE